MPRKRFELIVAAQRLVKARRIVADQNELIARRKALGQPTLDAERALETYRSALKHLEDHESRVRNEGKAKKRERKQKQNRPTT
jgi:hypothetical protein